MLTLLTVFVARPGVRDVSARLKPLQDVQGDVQLDAAATLTVRPFIDIWTTIPLARYFVNSLIVPARRRCCSVVGGDLRRVRGQPVPVPRRGVFTVTVLSTQMFPGILFLLPLFLIFVNIGNATGIELYGSAAGWSSPI